MDFFVGSGTTAAVALKMKRRFIAVDQMDYIGTETLKRLQKTIEGEQGGISQAVNWQGGGSFVYCELAKANQQFVEAIETAENNDALADIWQQMQATGYLNYKIDISTIDESATDFAALSLDDQKRFLIECLDKNMLYIPVSDMESEEYEISEEDKRLTKEFYKSSAYDNQRNIL
jgi:adenine-specific DNA-methyltransferase